MGIAMGGQGTDVALASADLVLMTNDLRRLGTCIRLSRRCRRTIYTNVAIGLVWTLAIVVCAVTGVLGALAAALLQNLSSLIVMFNAGRLLKFQELTRESYVHLGYVASRPRYGASRAAPAAHVASGVDHPSRGARLALIVSYASTRRKP